MSDPLFDSILKAHSALCPPGAFDAQCHAVDGRVQLRPDGPGRHLNCSVEIGCPAVLKPGCAKLQHGVAPVEPGAAATAQNGKTLKPGPDDGLDDLICE